MGLLALVLAGLTHAQTRTWTSDRALWTRAHAVAPGAPRPWLGMAWVAMRDGSLVEADAWLDQATALAARQPPMERDWALDAADTMRAWIRLRQGRLTEAAGLIAGAPTSTERWYLCQQVASVCALASSPP